ncbi:FAD-dependent monooxygenase [Couchioplanes caeruleus]|uniref:Squalene monooxygenase n=2 Tax=Couchioplanes caeruleus TaxID=56438 RepID=A0A1K0FE00_9ACTN|nr:FAD-dependent monooxygenase [Couchioplanes caeruleus]OJF11049.1 squalene monooxygenase [Couchioplanes caeruleus subsp. caeruleus]ROP33668.1 2-polyprenyl-6-methoxyphenol hydroxylase-like FAD-dependent oxidoreductase [Couchioplanes caeruleus]
MVSAGNAVVLGASMAGLIAARVLSDAYDTVTIIDRDTLPETAAARRGVPQSRQLHVLLAQGRRALVELFDGLSDELSAAGAPQVDLHNQVHWCNDGYPMRRAASDLIGVGISRPLLEATVRARVRKLANVRFFPPAEATALLHTDDRSRITGVLATLRTGTEYRLHADLVVDACGRASRSPVWLAELGYPAPAEQRVPVDVTYVTRTYERDARHLGGLLGALTNAVPGRPRTGIVAAQEDGRFAVALSGMLGEQPPLDDEGFTRFAESLGMPVISRLVRDAAPVGSPARMRFPASVRRRYERLRRFPLGYLVVGDAICSFNPLYGQGMTVAATEGLLLRSLLQGGPDRLARRFFRGAGKLIDGPWSIAVGTDLRFPEVPGPRSPRVRLINAYVHRLHAAARTDAVLGAAFLRVLNLVDPPTRLLRPAIVRRVFRARLRRSDD